MSNIIDRIGRALEFPGAAQVHVIVLDHHDGRAFHALPESVAKEITDRVPVRVGGEMLRYSCVVTSSDWDEFLTIHTI